MASITLSDNVLNATETATVTFTFDADYALLPEKITVTGGTLSTPVPFPARQSPLWQTTITPARTTPVTSEAGGVLAQSAAFTVDNVRPYIVDFEMPSVIQGSGAQTTITITY